MNDDPRIKNLPKWAQARIIGLERRLEADVAYWKSKANVDNAPTQLAVFRHDGNSTFLDNHESIGFGFPRPDSLPLILVRLHDDQRSIEVQGLAAVSIIPRVSNVVRIEVVDR